MTPVIKIIFITYFVSSFLEQTEIVGQILKPTLVFTLILKHWQLFKYFHIKKTTVRYCSTAVLRENSFGYKFDP